MAKNKPQKVNFTKAILTALECAEGEDRAVVYDTQVVGLGCRAFPTGRKVFFWIGKPYGKTIRATIGAFPYVSVEQARKIASGYNATPPEPPKKAAAEQVVVVGDLTVECALDACLATTSRGALARKDWAEAKAKFMAWLGKHASDVSLWKDLRRVHFREYLTSRNGLSDTRRRLDMQPLTQTARWMLAEYDCPNYADGLKLGSKLQRAPRAVYVKDVLSLLDYLRDNAPWLEAGAALQALAGLQLLEALRLTWDKVNLNERLVEISGEVKNEFRNRVIPVCPRVVEALRRAYPFHWGAKVRSLHEEYVVLSEKGKPYIGGSWYNYGANLGKAIRAWNPKCEWQAKNLRNCLITMFSMEGGLGAIQEQYVGHAARGVSARHYIPRLSAATEGEKDALKAAMGVFRRMVLRPLADAMKKAKQPALVVEISTVESVAGAST